MRAIALLHIGDVEGEVAGGEGLAVDQGGFLTRVVEDGEELRAVLVQELAAQDAGGKGRRVAHGEAPVEVELAELLHLPAAAPDHVGVCGRGVDRAAADVQLGVEADAVNEAVAEFLRELALGVAHAAVGDDHLGEGVAEERGELLGIGREVAEAESAVDELRVGGGDVGGDFRGEWLADAVAVRGGAVEELPAAGPFAVDARTVFVRVVEARLGGRGAVAVHEEAVRVERVLHELKLRKHGVAPERRAGAGDGELPRAVQGTELAEAGVDE